MAENTLARVGLCAGLSHMETDVLDGNATCLQRTECVQSTYWSSRFDQSSSAHNTKYLRQGSTKPRRNEQRTFSHLYPFFPFSTTISISLDRLLLGGSAGAAANGTHAFYARPAHNGIRPWQTLITNFSGFCANFLSL